MTSNALIPVESVLPVCSGVSGRALDHFGNPNRSGKDALLRIFTAEWRSGNYGPNGEEVLKTEGGALIDIYA